MATGALVVTLMGPAPTATASGIVGSSSLPGMATIDAAGGSASFGTSVASTNLEDVELVACGARLGDRCESETRGRRDASVWAEKTDLSQDQWLGIFREAAKVWKTLDMNGLELDENGMLRYYQTGQPDVASGAFHYTDVSAVVQGVQDDVAAGRTPLLKLGIERTAETIAVQDVRDFEGVDQTTADAFIDAAQAVQTALKLELGGSFNFKYDLGPDRSAGVRRYYFERSDPGLVTVRMTYQEILDAAATTNEAGGDGTFDGEALLDPGKNEEPAALPDYMDQAVLDQLGLGGLLEINPGVYTFENAPDGATVTRKDLRELYDALLLARAEALATESDELNNAGRLPKAFSGTFDSAGEIPDTTGSATEQFNLWLYGGGITPSRAFVGNPFVSQLRRLMPADVTIVYGRPSDAAPFGYGGLNDKGTQFVSLRLSKTANIETVANTAMEAWAAARLVQNPQNALTAAQQIVLQQTIRAYTQVFNDYLNTQAHLDLVYAWDNEGITEIVPIIRAEGNAGSTVLRVFQNVAATARWLAGGVAWSEAKAGGPTQAASMTEALDWNQVRLDNLENAARQAGLQVTGVGAANAVISEADARIISDGVVDRLRTVQLSQPITGTVNFVSDSGTRAARTEIVINDDSLAQVRTLVPELSGAELERTIQERLGELNTGTDAQGAVEFAINSFSTWGFVNVNFKAGYRRTSSGEGGPLAQIGIDYGSAVVFAPTFTRSTEAWLPRSVTPKVVWVNGQTHYARWNPNYVRVLMDTFGSDAS